MSTKYTLTGDYKISGFLGSIASSGGVSSSNLYEAKFEFDNAFNKDLIKSMDFVGFSGFTGSDKAYTALTLLCEEASLPGIQAMTGQTTGVYMGEGQINYAHTKSYTDITLGWTCDANLLPVKFLNKWSGFIFGEDANTTTKTTGRYRINRVRYPEEYQATLKIVKAERGKDNSLQGVGGIYTLYDIFPYSVQSTPLSYGASTLLKVTASFYYRRWDFEYINVTTVRPNIK